MPETGEGQAKSLNGLVGKGSLKIIEVQPPAMGMDTFPLNQVAQGSIQPGLEQFQG